MPACDRMELLAPAGDLEALKAAVQNGADAVYLGAGQFNARRRAGNFDGDGLKAAVDYCHVRGVKVHVTLNTLVRQDELEPLLDTIRLINQSGADAVIVQDFGVVSALRQMAPELALHASTQMAAHNAAAARFLKSQGFHRVVLAREATFQDMAACAEAGIEVEVFVHGALCVACSGQCLMSSLVGGRSGNRGLCAQPCRLPWRLDGREGYLLSTRDLCAIDDLPKLREIGVGSLKIEGRMKRAEYVAVTVAAYRRALDALYEGRAFDSVPEKAGLRQMFNRGGFTRGYGPGLRESELMYPERPNHAGVTVGACRRPGEVALEADVVTADALALRGRGEDVPVKLAGSAGQRVRCAAARPGDVLIRLVSADQMAGAQASFSGEHRQRELSAQARLRVDEPATLRVQLSDLSTAEAVGETVQRATGKPFDRERAAAQLSKTGGTPWRLDHLEIDADPDAFVPASALNALRRSALSQLEDQLTAVHREDGQVILPSLSRETEARPLLCVQSGSPAVLAEALKNGADLAVYCPEDLRYLDAAVLPERFALAVPPVLTDAALKALNDWALTHEDRIPVTCLSNVGQLGLSWPGERVGDVLLNVGNDLTTEKLNQWGLSAVTPSVELTARQIEKMGGKRHLIMWGRIPLMQLRHCPLRAAEGMAGLHETCRHCDACPPGDRLNGRHMTDRRGAAFPLNRIAMPGGCVVQVLNSVPLMPLNKLDRLPSASAWRLLLREDEPVAAILRVYRAALDGEDFKALPEWAILSQMDTTSGHYFRGVE